MNNRIRKDQYGQIHTVVALNYHQENVNGRTKIIAMNSDEELWKMPSPNVVIASKRV